MNACAGTGSGGSTARQVPHETAVRVQAAKRDTQVALAQRGTPWHPTAVRSVALGIRQTECECGSVTVGRWLDLSEPISAHRMKWGSYQDLLPSRAVVGITESAQYSASQKKVLYKC